jgi:hypothetical protein
MHRRSRGTTIAVALAPLLVTALLLAACDAAQPSLAPTVTSAATASPRLPTPVPTPFVTPAPTPSEVPGTEPPARADLVLRMTTCSDTCGPNAGTTILADGRIIYELPGAEGIAPQVLQSHLAAGAMRQVRETIDGVEALRRTATYDATVRPGAEPTPHGFRAYLFEVGAGKAGVRVSTVDPRSLGDEENLWIIPAEARELAAFSDLVADPLTWLGDDAFDEPARAYIPPGYILKTEAFPGIGVDETQVELDDVDWPLAGPLEGLGEPLPAEPGERPARCLLIDQPTGAALIAAERAAGVDRHLGEWSGTIMYNWRRANGWVDVTLMPLLPYQSGSCVELLALEP